MSRINPENAKIRHEYAHYLQAANGKQSATADAALRAIERFEISTNRKAFKKFHREQARRFRADLVEEVGPTGRPLSAATITATLKHLRNFFLWLSREPGYRSALNANDAAYFTPTDQDLRIASAHREPRVATLDEIGRVLACMPASTPIEKRDRAVVAFTILSGARDGALASFLLKHVDLVGRTVFQDGRTVRTKRRKSFISSFFPVGTEPLRIVADYVAFLKTDLRFGPDDPLFPKTAMGLGADRLFAPQGLCREAWANADPIRKIFRTAFAEAGLEYAKPHSFRTTLARLGEQMCRTAEEWKAWSQNLGHESETTTFAAYGKVPSRRQVEIMQALEKPAGGSLVEGIDVAALESVLTSLKRMVENTNPTPL